MTGRNPREEDDLGGVNMLKRIIPIVLLMLFAVASCAVSASAETGYPTRLETVIEQKGTPIRITRFPAGEVAGTDVVGENERTVMIHRVMAYAIGNDKLSAKGLSMTVVALDAEEKFGQAYIDFEEIGTLIKAIGTQIELLSKGKPTEGSTHDKVYFETKGGLCINIDLCNTDSATPAELYCYDNRIWPVYCYLSVPQLMTLKATLEAALRKLS